MRSALFCAFFLLTGTMLAYADENGTPRSSNMVSVPIKVLVKGPSDYPAGAAAKAEEGAVIISLSVDGWGPRAKILQSSGFSDLDTASTDIVLNAYKSSGDKGPLFAVIWKLKPDDGKPVQYQPQPVPPAQ